MGSRIIVLSGSEDLGPGRVANWVAWRLISANNRELGRSAVVHDHLSDCLSAVERIQANADHLEPRLLLDQRNNWTWALALEGDVAAVSGRGYNRERECRYSLAGFRRTLPEAAVISPVTKLGRRRRRELRPTDFLRRPSDQLRVASA